MSSVNFIHEQQQANTSGSMVTSQQDATNSSRIPQRELLIIPLSKTEQLLKKNRTNGVIERVHILI